MTGSKDIQDVGRSPNNFCSSHDNITIIVFTRSP